MLQKRRAVQPLKNLLAGLAGGRTCLNSFFSKKRLLSICAVEATGLQPWFAKPESWKLGLEKLSLLLEGLCQRAAFGELFLHLGNLKLGLVPTKLPDHYLEKLP